MTIPPQIQELIDGSGNNFHAKVARWFIADGWRTSISPYYLDQSQQKARELDLVMEKAFPMKGSFGESVGDTVVRLFVECKFVPGHGVFWFTDKNLDKSEDLVCASGLFRAGNVYTKKHHYLAGYNRVAKLFASPNARGQENEPFYKALNQVLNGFISLRPQQSSFHGRPGKVLAVLDFPIIICSSFSTLYEADFEGRREPIEIQRNFQLEVQYAYATSSGATRDELFLVDFVDFDKLPEFAASLQEDAELAGFFRT